MRIFGSTLRSGVSFAALAIVGMTAATAVHAQTADPAAEQAAPPQNETAVGDIVVMARKRAENLQDVPISITAFSGDTLQKMGVRGFNDLAISNPNVKIETAQGGIGTLGSSVAIRGNIQSATNLLPDPAVGTYMDGHILSRTFGTLGLTVDVASVQTLKGPQGTLFGRNTTGGAVLVQTVDPVLDEISGYAQIEGGEIETFNIGGAINVPLGEKVAIRAVYQHNSRGDYQNFSTGQENGRRRGDVLRAKLLFEPNDRLKIILSGEYTSETGYQALGPITHPNNPILDDVPVVIIPPGPGTAPTDVRANGERSHITASFFTLAVEQELGDGTLKFLASRRDYDFQNDATLAPNFGYTKQDKPNNDDTSLELQYAGKLFDNKLDVAGGLYYFNDHLNEYLVTHFYSGVAQATSIVAAKGESYSAYFQATGHVLDGFNITGGLRYTHDDKSAVGNIANFSATTSGDVPAALTNRVATWSSKQSKVNYLISADFSPIDGVMVYASHATGYRAAGANVTRVSTVASNPNFGLLQNFLPESIKNYEGGIKTEFWDRRVKLNAAYFYQDYQGYQYGSTDPVTILRRTFNSDAVIQGAEVDASVRLGSGTTISGTYGRVKAKIKDPASASNGARLPQIPKNTWSATFAQTFPVGDGTLDLLANYSWRGNFFTTIADPLTVIDESGSTTLDSLGLLSLSATYTKGPIQFSVNASNATNERYNTYATVVGSAINVGGIGVPRVISARLKYSF